jgi:hypothetical protein
MTHIGFRVSSGWITDMENANAGGAKGTFILVSAVLLKALSDERYQCK